MAASSKRGADVDFTAGIEVADVADGDMVQGRVGEDSVLLARSGDQFFALDSACTHYGAPLAKGLMVGETVRCPWHHACFSLRTGEALRAPAFDALGRWKIEREGNRLFIRTRLEPERTEPGAQTQHPGKIVIVGGGAAGFAAAEMLRRRGFSGQLTMLSSDHDPPYDRPNLSKDYLAGKAQEDWIPLKDRDFYRAHDIGLELQTAVTRLDLPARQVVTEDGRVFPFDRLLIATGAEPVRLSVPGADQPHVFTLRSQADSHAIIKRSKNAKHAVVLGASFIGLEVAAALRARGVEVDVVAPEVVPMQKVLGPELGSFVQSLHQQKGVRFHLQETAERIMDAKVVLKSGGALDADLVVAGIGVKPRTELAERAGIKVDRGVLVDEFLETSVPAVFAAGDIARWRDPRTGESLRVEHWVVAERQGQAAARNMLGAREPFVDVPFFWSRHYDVSIHYLGHAENWDSIDIEGSIPERNCLIRYRRNAQLLAIASMGRSVETLRYEAEFERQTDRSRITA